MLAKANRIVHAEDFRRVSRAGTKTSAAGLTVSVLSNETTRFGFIVPKTVGNAVQRNRLRRRMRAAAYAVLGQGSSNADMVVRAHPGSHDLSVDEITRVIELALQ